MHPIERLRYVARASGAPVDDVVREAAGSLAGFADDPVSLVTACRRLIDRHPTNGGVWWLCARMLAAAAPGDEARRCRRDLDADRTLREVAAGLPDGGRVVALGYPERLLEAFGPRGDLEVRVVDVDGGGPAFVRALDRIEVPAVDVRSEGLASVVAASDLVLVDATAVGPEAACAAPGSWAAASVAHVAGIPVWVVSGVDRLLPPGLWSALESRLAGTAPTPWDRPVDRLPLRLVDRLCGPCGPEEVAEGLRRVDAPDAPELRR